MGKFPDARIYLSVSVNEIFDPVRVEPFFRQSQDTRSKINLYNRATNYGVVRLELLEHIYETLYMQRIRQPNEDRWQHRILSNSNVVGVDTGNKSKMGLQIEQGGRVLSQEFDTIVSLDRCVFPTFSSPSL